MSQDQRNDGFKPGAWVVVRSDLNFSRSAVQNDKLYRITNATERTIQIKTDDGRNLWFYKSEFFPEPKKAAEMRSAQYKRLMEEAAEFKKKRLVQLRDAKLAAIAPLTMPKRSHNDLNSDVDLVSRSYNPQVGGMGAMFPWLVRD